MNFHDIFTSVISHIRSHRLSSAFGAVGLSLLVYGLISLLASSQSKAPFIFEGENSASAGVSENASKSGKITHGIMVDVEGAVVKPGVYTLSSDARIRDALIAAMGLSSTANRDWVSMHINLAAKLSDGAKVYIPSVGELGNSTVSGSGAVVGDSTSSQININTASMSELDSLSGVGPVTAQKIIDNRPYTDIQELLNKKVIGNSVFEKIKEKITVY